MKKWIKYILIGLLVILLVTFAGFYIWTQQTRDATDELYSLVNENEWSNEDNIVTFLPEEPNGTGIVLYPGGKVEPEAYAYYAKGLAEEGYLVAIPAVRLNLAMLDQSRAEDVFDSHPSIEKWVIGGHSLGGVGAALYAQNNPKKIEGIIFLASYPGGGADFSGTDLPMLLLYGENDGLSTVEDIKESEALLSDEALLHGIKGGNHAQFGMYGEQPGDMAAAVSAKEQQAEMMSVTLEWLTTFK
ncbi:alpha/beta hydrolase [Jeotgalibacillus proteolyticus]|uniref:Alpha/beta hydrolase n=1 Tax=Jeotgalibacillus proteolyticus TaxID=2082395 RepID=A0A2S5GD42_9BACL|nr:alpha/beta hydrolase [Jeotgalibacillus proteolyticus]PPA70957.1 alpha/beta hydrolase [Jeotgalibacillus proteolyticus]